MTAQSMKKRFSFGEFYRILRDGMRTAPRLSRARRLGLMDKPFMERIMMAVTEVNGCAMCSYAHSKMALGAGMSDSEIKKMLDGRFDDAPEEQMTAILFAQLYADSRAKPDSELWSRLTDRYGTIRAEGILGAIRIIMMGNALGIPWGSLIGRFRRKADPRSSLAYEVGMLFGFIAIFPVAVVDAVIAGVTKRPLIR